MEIQWTLVLYSLFMGLAIGPFALLALTDACEQRSKLCTWVASIGLGSIAAAGISAFTHLKQPLHAVYMFTNFRSAMTQETVVVLLTGLTAALLAAAFLFNWLPGPTRKVLAWVGLVLTVVSVVMIAMIYLLPARPAWNTVLLPLALLASSIANGLLLAWALVVLIPLQAGEEGRNDLAAQLRTWALPALVVYGVIAIIFFLLIAGEAGGATRLLTGDLALMFWLGLVGAGIAAPGVLLWLGKKDPQFNALAAFVLVVTGGIVVRAMLFPLGVRIPLTSLW